MARARFSPGQRFTMDGKTFYISENLLHGKLRLENQTEGGVTIRLKEDLHAAWVQGKIKFEIEGKNTHREDETGIITSYEFSDFQILDEKYQEEAFRRYAIILPLLKLPAEERTRKNITEYVEKIKEDTNYDGAKVIGLEFSGKLENKSFSERSVARWLKDYIDSGSDLKSLVPAYYESGAPGKSRLNSEVENIICKVFDTCKKNKKKRSVEDIYLMVVREIDLENRCRPDALPKLKAPARSTIYRRIQKEGVADLLRRRQSRGEKQKSEPVYPFRKASRILERVEIDFTLLDVIVVDPIDGSVIGRPWLGAALDTCSSMGLAYSLGFEPPSYRSVMHCLLNMLLPKANAPEIFGTKNSWPRVGLPETLAVDKGKEFINRHLKAAMSELGIILEEMPGRTPWFRGAGERFFRSLNSYAIHSLPGTTDSNIQAKGDYQSEKSATLSLFALEKILNILFLDLHAEKWNRRIEATPRKKWEQNILDGFEPVYYHDADELRLILYRTEIRTLQPSGIEFESLLYQSPDSAHLRTILQNQKRTQKKTQDNKNTPNPRVFIKINPDDISSVYVPDPLVKGKWIEFPAINQEYASGLSLWKHRVNRRFVLDEEGKVSDENLAEAKAKIQAIVDDEKRKKRNRQTSKKKAARYEDHGIDSAKSRLDSDKKGSSKTNGNEPTEAPADFVMNDDHGIDSDKKGSSKTNGNDSTEAPADFVMNDDDWGADFSLPTKDRL